MMRVQCLQETGFIFAQDIAKQPTKLFYFKPPTGRNYCSSIALSKRDYNAGDALLGPRGVDPKGSRWARVSAGTGVAAISCSWRGPGLERAIGGSAEHGIWRRGGPGPERSVVEGSAIRGSRDRTFRRDLGERRESFRRMRDAIIVSGFQRLQLPRSPG